MKNGKPKKKSKTSNSKRANKKKKQKTVKSSRGSNRKTGNTKASPRPHKNVRRNKRGRQISFNKLSQEEREIYRAFNDLRLADEKKNLKAKVTKKRNDKLFVIKLNQKGFQNKIIALRNADFSNIDKFLRNKRIEPLYAFVTLKIKKPGETGYYFNGQKSPSSMVVNAENTKNFCINVLVSYNNDMVDLIQEKYDDDIKVYNVAEMSIRFLFPTTR